MYLVTIPPMVVAKTRKRYLLSLSTDDAALEKILLKEKTTDKRSFALVDKERKRESVSRLWDLLCPRYRLKRYIFTLAV